MLRKVNDKNGACPWMAPGCQTSTDFRQQVDADPQTQVGALGLPSLPGNCEMAFKLLNIQARTIVPELNSQVVTRVRHPYLNVVAISHGVGQDILQDNLHGVGVRTEKSAFPGNFPRTDH